MVFFILKFFGWNDSVEIKLCKDTELFNSLQLILYIWSDRITLLYLGLELRKIMKFVYTKNRNQNTFCRLHVRDFTCISHRVRHFLFNEATQNVMKISATFLALEIINWYQLLTLLALFLHYVYIGTCVESL